MTQHASRIAAELSCDAARRGATVVAAVQLGLHTRRRVLESHRRAGVHAVGDLSGRLAEARGAEEQAWEVASSLSHENASLRESLAAERTALAAAQARIARLEAAIVAAAARVAR
jgi:hypothetical protein